MLFYTNGSADHVLDKTTLRHGLETALDQIENVQRVLAIPPDITRFHSRAGLLTGMAYDYYGSRLTDILPALGTHAPMSGAELTEMFPDIPQSRFRVHNWREDITTLGEVPSDFVKDVSDERVTYPWPAQVNQMLVNGGHDLILSIGQVVPHEVIGMANYNKNIFVGTGGAEGINKSHFLGAAYGMENIMGRTDTPVRQVLNYASDHFATNLPIVYVLTVVGRNDNGELVTRGLFIGDDETCFRQAADLAREVNFEMLDQPIKKAVVYLDPAEFKSTWLGNKAIYRTRMAMADQGELIILAPGLKQFGEDKANDALIRKYGYIGTPRVLELVENHAELQKNLSAAAHLIHGSTEGRFQVTYCPGHLTQKEIEDANFEYASLEAMLDRYNPDLLKDGYNKLPDGERIFYVSNPATGLWASKARFQV